MRKISRPTLPSAISVTVGYNLPEFGPSVEPVGEGEASLLELLNVQTEEEDGGDTRQTGATGVWSKGVWVRLML